MDENILIIVGIVVIILFLFLAKWVFRIDTIVMELKALRKLMSLQAEKQGVDKGEIDEVNRVANKG